GSGKNQMVASKRMKISVPKFDNANLIAGYSRTLIGQCMNPHTQDMKTLLYMLPRIWKVEERVAGADLGLGRFQFDFDREEDIAEVMKMEPFHFDYWMLSLVRWTPVVDPNYPSAIKFWIRVIGVPLHFWADLTFRTIGKALGKVEAVNLDEGKIQVIVDGLKPLCFETTVEFHGGEETTIYLRYERLFGYCRECFSLCHDYQRCPERATEPSRRLAEQDHDDSRGDSDAVSFKAAMINGKPGSKDNSQSQNKGKEIDQRGGQRKNHYDDKYGKFRVRSDRRVGESSSRYSKSSGYSHPKAAQKIAEGGHEKDQLIQAFIEEGADQSRVKSARKSLYFEEDDTVAQKTQDEGNKDLSGNPQLGIGSDSGSKQEAKSGEEITANAHGIEISMEERKETDASFTTKGRSPGEF
ncbi:hypothetical protein EUTSA_v10002297mg, partial [Eutrema salsugineum]